MSPSSSNAAHHSRGIALAALGVLVLSFDALLVRLADAPAWDVVFWRGWLIFASLGTYVLVLPGERQTSAIIRPHLWAAFGVMLLYGLNASLFVLSIANTRVANTVVILSAAPFFAALLSWLTLGERPRARTWGAIGVAIAGVIAVLAGSVRLDAALGDGLALLLAITAGMALTLLRRFPHLPRAPLVCGSGAIAGLLAWPWAHPWSLSAASYGWLAIMGLVQMPLAGMLIMSSTRYLPSPEVALFLLIETVLGPTWVWLVIGEEPPGLTLVGGTAIVGAIAVHSWLGLRELRSAAIPPADP